MQRKKKSKCECKDNIYIYKSVNARKFGKSGCDICFSLAIHVSKPQSLLTFLIFLAASEVQQLLFFFLYFPFLCSSFFFLPYTATSLPSFLTKNSSFFEEEITQLTLRFYLQSVWVSKLNLI